MTLVYIALQHTIDNFIEYLDNMRDIHFENQTLLKRFEDDEEAKKFADEMYKVGFDTFSIISRWHDEEEG